MKLSRFLAVCLAFLRWAPLGTGLIFATATGLSAAQQGTTKQFGSETVWTGSYGQPGASQPPASVCEPASMGSPYVTVDSWIYPAVLRLYGLGFLDHVFVGMRPWTRSSINRMLEDVSARIEDFDPTPSKDQAQELYEAIAHELRNDMTGPCLALKGSWNRPIQWFAASAEPHCAIPIT